MTTANSPLICDTVNGICEVPVQGIAAKENSKLASQQKPLKLIYFTDPICSSCWAIEPKLRRLKLEYGSSVEIEYHMGGLLPDWSYNSGGISKPADVAHHWDEMSKVFEMPIDGDVWLEDPLNSSYPPSIAFKAAQLQNNDKAVKFLRVLREMVFLQKKNITKWEHMEAAAKQCGLDAEKLRHDYEGEGKKLFEADLSLTRSMQVRGFPTFFITDRVGKTQEIPRPRSYSGFENAIRNSAPSVKKENYLKNWEYLFGIYPTLTRREFAELMDISNKDADLLLKDLAQKNMLTVLSTKNGELWIRK